MSRNRVRKGRPISGWLALDKPEGIGSTECVSKLKRLYEAAKCGHAGTLDPLASGMLPIALGEATRTVPHVMDGWKAYRFSVAWGSETDTGDLEGEAVESSESRPAERAIRSALESWVGEVEQVPPAFSAVRVGGERAYRLARNGEIPELAPRLVEIRRLDLLRAEADFAEFECVCGKGAYIRSLARDVGRELKCFGHISALRRIAVEPFAEADMIRLDALLAMEGDLESLDGILSATGIAVSGLPRISITPDQAHCLRRGGAALLRGRDAPIRAERACAVQGSELVAIGAVEKGFFHPRRVFRFSAA